MYLISKSFIDRAYQIFNPRNAMYISRSNGMLNKDVLPQRDTLINSNTMRELVLDDYSNNDMNTMKDLLERNKQIDLAG